MCRTNRHEIIVGNSAKVTRVKGHQCLRPTGCRDELDAHRIRAVVLDNGAEIALPEPVRCQVAREHDNVENLHRHWLPPG